LAAGLPARALNPGQALRAGGPPGRFVPEIIAHLSTLYHLGPGDIVFAGTPAGVGPVEPGDHLRGRIQGLIDLELTIGPPDKL
jgi:hypothetical protein